MQRTAQGSSPFDALPWVVDLETRGTNPADENFMVVGIGLANSHGVLYVGGTSNESQESIQWLANFLLDHQIPLIAHNVNFDGAALVKLCNPHLDFRTCRFEEIRWHNWKYDTYAMYRHLASEGFIGQTYGLKAAQTQLLKWEESNDVELINWLKENSYVNQQKEADKSQMWRAPFDILGHYCALDCESTLLLFNEILAPVYGRFLAYHSYHSTFIEAIKLVIWQKLCGVTLDKERLLQYRQQLIKETSSLRQKFISLPRVAPHVAAYNNQKLQELKNKEPAQYKKRPPLKSEPRKYTVEGKVSGTWEKWEAKRLAYDTSPGDLSQTWVNWKTKYDLLTKAIQEDLPHEELFNINSGRQKQWLFYDALQFPVVHWTDNETNPQPAINEDALKEMGEEGNTLISYNERMKMLSMVEGCIETVVAYEDEPTIARAHVGLRTPGTFTGRLGGTDGVNLQNVPKDAGYLECWVPPPGEKLLIFDVSALEPHVLAAASGDKSLLNLYGPDAVKGQDVYLYVGAQLGGEVEKTIRATGFDPFNPTKENTNKAKKEAKKYRNISKVIHLSCIAEGTLVRVQNQGWLPIEKITTAHIVWDGEQWVKQSGAVLRGTKKCIKFGESIITPDHEVLTNDGWKISERTNPSQCVRPKHPSASWSDVWRMAGNLFKCVASTWSSHGYRLLHNLWDRV